MPPIQRPTVRSGPPPVEPHDGFAHAPRRPVAPPEPDEDDYDESAMFQTPEAATGAARGRSFAPPPRFAPPPPPPPAQNPLAKYFRVPGLVVRLPTGGAFLPEGALDIGMSGEIEVWPMRTADELLLKSPDALMSGFAVERLLQSCVPGLRTPRLVSQPDLDVLLLAIRAATTGETMDVNADCPSCGTANTAAIHLPTVLSTMRPVPHENPVRLSDEVMAYVRPFNLDEATRIALASFEEARKLQATEQDERTESGERSRQMNSSFERLAGLNVSVVASCVAAVATPEGAVSDPRAIQEFMANIPSSWFRKIEAKLRDLNALGIDKKVALTCTGCGNGWTTDLEFNPSTFFG